MSTTTENPPRVVEEEIKMSQPLPPLLFPLSETNNGEGEVENEWPCLPRSNMQGMPLQPSLPKCGGGWMELFANKNQNSSVVGLTLSSRKRTQPSPPTVEQKKPDDMIPPKSLVNNIDNTPPSPRVQALNPLQSTVEQKNRDDIIPPKSLVHNIDDTPRVQALNLLQSSVDDMISPQSLVNNIDNAPPPPRVQMELVEEKSSPKQKINEQKAKQPSQKAFQNPFALLADMKEEEPEECPRICVLPKHTSINVSKRKNKRGSQKSLDGVDKTPRTTSFLIHVSTLLWIIPFCYLLFLGLL